MNDKELKVNVISKDGAVCVLTGNNFVELQDITTAKYVTNSIADFARYTKDNIVGDWPIFITETGCCVYDPNELNRYTTSVAKLELSISPYITSFGRIVNSDIKITEFEKFLRSMLDFADKEAIRLYDFCRNLDIKSITQIRRAVDNQGNFILNVSRQAGENDNLNLPEKVHFSLPVFRKIPEAKKIFSFTTSLDYDSGKDGAVVTLQLMNYTWDDCVMSACKDVCYDHLKELPNPKYWGAKVIEHDTDSWKYQTK